MHGQHCGQLEGPEAKALGLRGQPRSSEIVLAQAV